MASELPGVGPVTQPLQSAQLLQWENPDRNTGCFQPYVLQQSLVNLWGREMLEQMRVLITSLSSIVTSQMLTQGFHLLKGLVEHQQGRLSSIPMSTQKGEARIRLPEFSTGALIIF